MARQWPLLMCVAFTPLAACAGDDGARADDAVRAGRGQEEWFSEQAEAAGLDFVHVNGMSGRFYDAEIFGPGVGLLDYDNDGDLDVYLVQGQMLGAAASSPPRLPPPPRLRDPGPLRDRLFRNDLQVHPDGTRTLRFTDVTDQSGIDARGYGMGVATGDYDNDGWVDLYVTRLGSNALFRNNGNGTFTDVSAPSGTDQRAWSIAASFVDVDRDGWLDLYVGNYLSYSTDTDVDCFGLAGERDYCPPAAYRPVRDRLYRNRGDGTFVDVTAAALGPAFGAALGVATADFDGDGWVDIYVANDSDENQLWINQRNGTFRDTGLLSGVALNAAGRPEASMGVDAGDFDNDGDEDIVITNLTGEGIALYVNDGSGVFEERSVPTGLRPASLPYTGFGAAWFDFDNDTWLDVLTVNGAVRTIEALARARDPFPLHQRKQLFRNVGGRFEDVTGRAGPAFELSDVGRGAAFGDLDNDGDIDVVVGHNNGRVRLLVNDVGNRGHWVGLRLVGTNRRRDMVGARVGVVRRDGSVLWRRARADGSYGSANDPRVLVGLGDATDPPRVRVVWPSGRTEEWSGVSVDRWTTLQEGTGR